MFSGSGATDDFCSQQSNSTALQAYAAACISQQLQPLPNSGGYLLDVGTGSLSPVKPSHLILLQALEFPQPPPILTNFGALSVRSPPEHKQCPARAPPSWACPRCLLLLSSAIISELCSGAWGRQGQEDPAQLRSGCLRPAQANSFRALLRSWAAPCSLCLPASSLDCKPAVGHTGELLGAALPAEKRML